MDTRLFIERQVPELSANWQNTALSLKTVHKTQLHPKTVKGLTYLRTTADALVEISIRIATQPILTNF